MPEAVVNTHSQNGELPSVQGATLPSRKDTRFDQAGILKHGEHICDLVLSINSGQQRQYLASFRGIMRGLISSVRRGVLNEINEKIDGSPAILLGFDSTDIPFICYKGGLTKRGPQKILRTQNDVDNFYGKSREDPARKGLYNVLSECVRVLPSSMHNLPDKNVLYQADLLFTRGDERRTLTAGETSFQANPAGIHYRIIKGHTIYEKATAADVGLVIHTSMQRQIDPDGRLSAGGRFGSGVVELAVEAMQSDSTLILHPFRKHVSIKSTQDDPGARAEIALNAKILLAELSNLLKNLPRPFLIRWPRYEKLMRIYLNSSLKDGHRGGIYRAAKDGEAFDFEKLSKGFSEFLASREFPIVDGDKVTSTIKRVRAASVKMGRSPSGDEFNDFRERFSAPLERLLNAYYLANKLQAILIPQLTFGSLLGGGPIEGMMLEDAKRGVVVKLVDRMGFTIANNRGRFAPGVHRIKSIEELPAPFNEPLPAGSLFLPMKIQPSHIGHISLIRYIAKLNPGRNIYVIASTKSPKLDAQNARATQLADTLRKIRAHDFDHPFSLELRRRLISEAKLPANVQICFTSPAVMWSHLSLIKSSHCDTQQYEPYKLVVGQKEITAKRYDANLRALKGIMEITPLPLLEDGISGTDVRELIKELAVDPEASEAHSYLNLALGYIEDPIKRKELISALLTEWKFAAEIADKLIHKPTRQVK